MESLKDIAIEGLTLDGFVEESHRWERDANLRAGLIPYKSPWIGFLHNPPGMPAWYQPEDSPGRLLAHDSLTESLESCLGLFTLSRYAGDWLRERTGLVVSSLMHPTQVPETQFTLDDFRANPDPKIVQVGYWLRRLRSIQSLPTCAYSKVWLVPKPAARIFRDTVEVSHDDVARPLVGRYDEIDWMPHEDYDRLLASNIVFMDYYDVSASNAIIECIARNTPLLVNRLPAVVEYLGEDYPFYFEDLEEAARKAENLSLVEETHDYLRQRDKESLDPQFFKESFLASEVIDKCRIRLGC